MRILHIYKHIAHDGGIPGQVTSIALAQRDLGHDVQYVSPESGHTPRSLAVPSVSTSAARSQSWDVAHAHGFFVPWDLLQLLTIPARHRWISPHGVLSPLGLNQRFGGGRHPLRRRLPKHLYRVIGISILNAARVNLAAEAEYELVSCGLKPQSAVTVPMGIDAGWVRSVVHNPESGIVTYIGRLDIFHKSLDLLLSANALLPEASRPRRIVLVGTDQRGSVSRLRHLVRDSGATNVEIRGPAWDAEKDEILANTQWFWGAFRYAGMARATGEAIARGIPVIGSLESCWGDWIRSEGLGLVVDLAPRAVADALATAINTRPDEYQRMQSSLRRFAERSTWDATALALCDAYAR